MRHELPDRAPVFCQLALGHYFLKTGLAPHRIWFTSEGFAEALVSLQQRYQFDGILINLPGRSVDTLKRLERVETTPEGERLFWPNGEVTVVPNDDNPQHFLAGGRKAPRADFRALDPNHLAEATRLPGYLWNVYHLPWLDGDAQSGLLRDIPEFFLRTIDLVKAQTAGKVSIHGEVFSPFTHLMELFGYPQALLGLATDAAKAHALLERLVESSVAWGVAQARRGVDAVLVSSAFAGGGFISRRMYEEFVVPCERQLNRAIRAAGVPVYTHTCGKIGDRLDLMLRSETCGVDTLDPPPLGNVELVKAKREIGRRLFIKGNMNPVALLACKTAAEVVAEATRCLRDGAPGGGYILSTACSVAPRVESWKLELLAPLA